MTSCHLLLNLLCFSGWVRGHSGKPVKSQADVIKSIASWKCAAQNKARFKIELNTWIFIDEVSEVTKQSKAF